MRKYLKVFGFSTLVALVFSMPQTTQCMDYSTKDLDKNLSVPSGTLNFERETYDVLNQEIVDYDCVCSKNKIKNNSLIDYSPLLKQSAILIKEAARYTLDHPIQTALIGLSCQLGMANACGQNACGQEDVKYITGAVWLSFQAFGMACDSAVTLGNFSDNQTNHSLNVCNHTLTWIAWTAGIVTGAIIYWENKCKGNVKKDVELLPTDDTSYSLTIPKRKGY